MPIRRYANVLLLAPPIASALVGVLGLLLGVVLLSRHSHTGNPSLDARTHPAPSTARNPAASDRSPQFVRAAGTAPATIPERKARAPRPQAANPHLRQALFLKPIPAAQLAFLNDDAGLTANDVIRQHQLRELLDQVVPYVPFHLGQDMPLPQVVAAMFSASPQPVEIRAGRYLMLTGIRGHGGRGRAFLWIDMTQGIALGGIFFYPSNGEPSPTLTLFSRQIDRPALGMRQLPPAFLQDLSQWSVAQGLPLLTTRYFVNASGQKTVLSHDEDLCSAIGSIPSLPHNACSQTNAEAARLDAAASAFLSRVNYASNATMRMVAGSPRSEVLVSP